MDPKPPLPIAPLIDAETLKEFPGPGIYNPFRPPLPTFAQQLHRIMADERLTQDELAEVIGVDNSTLSRYLAGQIPRLKRAREIEQRLRNKKKIQIVINRNATKRN
jgi:predicted transcriptional regulator